MISILLVFLLFAVLQVAAVFYVRNVVAASAADGARYAATGADPGDGGRRASALIADGLNTAMSRQLPCTGSTRYDAVVGLAVVGVRCTGRIRSIFLPFGAFTRIDVIAHSVREPA